MEIKEVLDELATPRTVFVESSPILAQKVMDAAEKLDKKLAEGGHELPHRKRMHPLPQREAIPAIEVTPWEVLHRLGLATVLSGQGASRGLAEHWGCLKYCEALGGHPNGRGAMALSAEGLTPVHHHKTVQSEELGIGLALAAATRILARRLPGHTINVIDADVALQAGWALAGRELVSRDDVKLRPDYFIEAYPPSGPPTVVVLECKGTHMDVGYAHKQLAKASSQVHAVHLAGRGPLPSLAVAAQLRAKPGITLHVLDPDGDGALELYDETELSLNTPAQEINITPHFDVPVDDEQGRTRLHTISGFQIKPENYAWFRKVLARTTAAGLMAFCGARNGAAPYLTKRQGAERFKQYVFAGTGSVQDVDHRIRGLKFVGTDQVFRLNGVRLEAFSGMAKPLFDRLLDGDVASYRRQALDIFDAWSQAEGGGWNGPVSVRPDGSIMALRRLRD